jgi:fluoride exporter
LQADDSYQISYLEERGSVNQHRSFVFFSVFIGGGIGSMLRHAVNQAMAPLFGMHSGTLVVNVAGSFLMGLLAGWFAFRGSGGQGVRLFLATGVLGGFTTFSAFSLEAALLFERGQFGGALLYIAGNLAGGVLGIFAGMYLLRP